MLDFAVDPAVACSTINVGLIVRDLLESGVSKALSCICGLPLIGATRIQLRLVACHWRRDDDQANHVEPLHDPTPVEDVLGDECIVDI